jgi:hypothetical protein
MPAARTSNYIATIPMKSEEQVMEVKKVLEQIFGWVTLRGRHTDRKSVLGNHWSKSRQNDIPWRKAEYIDIYLHYENPNRMRVWKKQGMQRNNLQLNDTNVMVARMIGGIGLGLSDVVKYQEETKQNNPLTATIDLYHQSLMQDPKYKRKEMKRKYQNKSYKLQPGDWGYIAQALLDFTEKYGRVTFSELKEYYDVILRGNSHMIKGGSFTHHLQSLRRYVNAKGRRCGRYLIKDTNDGKYLIGK